MNKQEYLKELIQGCKKHGINPANVIISHGGASLIYDLRTTTEDIDVAIPKDDYDRLLKTMKATVIPPRNGLAGVEFISEGNIDWHCYTEACPHKDTVIYKGFKLTTKYQLICDRLELSRRKDVQDILSIISREPKIQLLLNSKQLSDIQELRVKYNM